MSTSRSRAINGLTRLTGNNRHDQCYSVTADINEGGIVCRALNGWVNAGRKQKLEAGHVDGCRS